MCFREGTLRPGDRLLTVDGVPLHNASHSDALSVLAQCGQEALLHIEYDVTIMGARTQPTQMRTSMFLKTSKPIFGIFHHSWTSDCHTQHMPAIYLHSPHRRVDTECDFSDTLTNASGPLLVEMAKPPGATLGITLTSASHRNKRVIVIERVKPGSVVDRYVNPHRQQE